jgi:hypothetical protein
MRKGIQAVRQADQKQLGLRVMLEKVATRRQRDAGAMITPHAVNSECGHGWSMRSGKQELNGASIKTKARSYRFVASGLGLTGSIRIQTWF